MLQILLIFCAFIFIVHILRKICTKKRTITHQTRILITGAANGLGREIAQNFALHHRCIFALIDILDGAQVVESLKKSGSQVHFYQTDLSKKENVYSLLNKIQKEVGNIDILINNAAVSFGKNFEQLPQTLFELTIDVNIKAPIYILRHFLPKFKRRNSGHIVTISSVTAKQTGPQNSYYAATKACIGSIHQAIRYQLSISKSNIDTTVIMPYAINTGMFRGFKIPIFPMLNMNYVGKRIYEAIINRQQNTKKENKINLLKLDLSQFFSKYSDDSDDIPSSELKLFLKEKLSSDQKNVFYILSNQNGQYAIPLWINYGYQMTSYIKKQWVLENVCWFTDKYIAVRYCYMYQDPIFRGVQFQMLSDD